MRRYLVFISTFLLFFTFFVVRSLSNAHPVSAQLCSPTIACPSGWFCSVVSGTGNCCKCDYGWGSSGPVTCCGAGGSCYGGTRSGCAPVPTPTQAPDPTATPTPPPCCRGTAGTPSFLCNSQSSWASCTGIGCEWFCAVPTPTPIPPCCRGTSGVPSFLCGSQAAYAACIGAGCEWFCTVPSPTPTPLPYCVCANDPNNFGVCSANVSGGTNRCGSLVPVCSYIADASRVITCTGCTCQGSAPTLTPTPRPVVPTSTPVPVPTTVPTPATPSCCSGTLNLCEYFSSSYSCNNTPGCNWDCSGLRYCIDTDNDGDGDTISNKRGAVLYLNTAIGCVPAEAKTLIAFLMRILLGAGGGIALLMTIYSGFLITTAGGDPKKVQAGKELLTASLAGLAFIALSIVILNFVGVNVLGLSLLGFKL